MCSKTNQKPISAKKLIKNISDDFFYNLTPATSRKVEEEEEEEEAVTPTPSLFELGEITTSIVIIDQLDTTIQEVIKDIMYIFDDVELHEIEAKMSFNDLFMGFATMDRSKRNLDKQQTKNLVSRMNNAKIMFQKHFLLGKDYSLFGVQGRGKKLFSTFASFLKFISTRKEGLRYVECTNQFLWGNLLGSNMAVLTHVTNLFNAPHLPQLLYVIGNQHVSTEEYRARLGALRERYKNLRCTAQTQRGKLCKRKSAIDSQFCSTHS